ncbi:hypothetical protein [Nakamurella endophytica]|uniref:Phosphoglucose isomerase-like protein n=1 Tax=Nakamurella endophytica TaxID=1748367 RepID=A0A917SXL8_9ACTN|nr:hypothetical protein [Nakamurella endophytica]GGM01331.1 hypothetical protein GCM10011594_21730 [Nakamurella endophytica]
MTGVPTGADLLRDRAAVEAADAAALLAAAGTAGAQVRSVAEQVRELGPVDRPRALVLVGPTAGTDAAVLAALAGEAARTPVLGLPDVPAWVGPLDLVVVLAGRPDDERAALAAATALHRGARTVVRASADGPVALAAGAALLPPAMAVPEALAAPGRWALVTGVAAASGLLPHGQPADLADLLDRVAVTVHPAAETFLNPAVNLAEYLLDGVPLLVGADPLADALAQHAAAVFGEVAGVPAAVLPSASAETSPAVLTRAAGTRDLFADPFDDPAAAVPARPVLVSTVDPVLPSRDAGRLSALRRALPSAMHVDGPAAAAEPVATDAGTGWEPVPPPPPPGTLRGPARGGPGPGEEPDLYRAERPARPDALAAVLAAGLQLTFAAVYLGLATAAPLPGDYPQGLGRRGTAHWAVRPATVAPPRGERGD